MSLARQLYSIFFEGCTHYSIAKINSKGNLAYYTEEGIPTLGLIEQHLRGEVVLGAYTLLPGNTVRWMAFDVDAKGDPAKAKEIAQKICEFIGGIAYVIEWSGNKGYHIIIFFAEPVPAIEAKTVGDRIRETLNLPKSGDPHVEVYPKQDKLTESNPLGNLLRLPLGRHPTTHNFTFFVDPYNGWEEGPEKPSEKLLEWRVTLDEVRSLIREQDPMEQVKALLQPYWSSGQRHDMALYTAGYLASLGWTEEAVVHLVNQLTEDAGDGDLENLVECVTDTFAKIYKSQSVRGFDGLAQMLPSKVLQDLTEAASNQTFSATLQVIDRIRLGKGLQFQKVRLCARTIISYFKEKGQLVRDSGFCYWLERETRDVFTVGGDSWGRFMHANFGLNPVDSFGKQTLEAVRMYSYDEAQVIPVHRRTHWSGEANYLNLGGSTVYVIDGGELRTILNGDDGIIFLNSEDSMNLPNLLESSVPAISPWEILVNDLSFQTGDLVNATPIQQRELLKALILCTFFGETMPTRPILALIADAGAGKTTAARRILRFLEGPLEDVLGLISDKPDSLRSSIMRHKVLVLDNLEKTKAHWLTDVLNRASTGSHIEIRTLYKTNEATKLIPNCFIFITATEMPFSEETVFSRMLPIQLAPLAHPKAEYAMQVQLVSQYEALWKGMINDLNEAVRQLKKNRTVEAPNESRLADFTVFCARVQKAKFIDGAELMAGLNSLISRQKKALQNSSPFIPVLEIWLKMRPDEAGKWQSMSELFNNIKRTATANRMEWRWSSAQGLSRHVSALELQLIKDFGMSVRQSRRNGSEIKEYKFTYTAAETE